MTARISIVSVNTGQSARRAPVFGGTPLELTIHGLDGDGQHDPEQAVRFYPREHYTFLAEMCNAVFAPGDLGENVTVDGNGLSTIGIGDRWRWGDAVVEVTGPWTPDDLDETIRNRFQILGVLRETGRLGWVCKVMQPGSVPVTGDITLDSRPEDAVAAATVSRGSVDADDDGNSQEVTQELPPRSEM